MDAGRHDSRPAGGVALAVGLAVLSGMVVAGWATIVLLLLYVIMAR